MMDHEIETPHLVTIKKASEIIGVQYRQILNALHEGIIPHYRLGNSRMLVNVSEVISIMRNNGAVSEISNIIVEGAANDR